MRRYLQFRDKKFSTCVAQDVKRGISVVGSSKSFVVAFPARGAETIVQLEASFKAQATVSPVRAFFSFVFPRRRYARFPRYVASHARHTLFLSLSLSLSFSLFDRPESRPVLGYRHTSYTIATFRRRERTPLEMLRKRRDTSARASIPRFFSARQVDYLAGETRGRDTVRSLSRSRGMNDPARIFLAERGSADANVSRMGAFVSISSMNGLFSAVISLLFDRPKMKTLSR